MRLLSCVIGLGILANLALFAADVYGAQCPNQGATGSGPTSQTPPTTTCDNQDPCGYVLTYTPPATSSCVVASGKCCVDQVQQGYTQPWSCQGTPSKCTGGAKNHTGNAVIVKTTVTCNADGSCPEAPSDY